MKGKDRVVRQPGSLNCYETVGEKAFLSPTCISFWKVIVLLFSPHSEIYLNSSPLPFLSCTTLVTQLRLSAALRLDTRNYGMFHHIFNNDKRTVRDVSLRFSQRGTLFNEFLSPKLNVSSYVPPPSSVQFDPVKTTGTVSEENVLFYARRSKIGYEEIFFTRFTGKKRPGR